MSGSGGVPAVAAAAVAAAAVVRGGGGAAGGAGGGGNVSAASAAPAPSRIPLPRPRPPGLRRSASLRLWGDDAAEARWAAAGGYGSWGGGGGVWSGVGGSGGLGNASWRPPARALRSLSSLSSGGGGSAGAGARFPFLAPEAPRSAIRQTAAVAAAEEELDDEEEVEACSLRSFGSARSALSCDHAAFARNGTTFSGRRMRYVVHCSPHANTRAQPSQGDAHGDALGEYLTPTQRAARRIRTLKGQLAHAQGELQRREGDVQRLTRELMDLRLRRASPPAPASPTDAATPSDAATPDADADAASPDVATLDTPDAPAAAGGAEKTSSPSLADSGHFEDVLATPEPVRRALALPLALPLAACAQEEALAARVRALQAEHVGELQELKERHNDKVEALLQRLSTANQQQTDLRLEFNRAQDKIRNLEQEVSSLRKSLDEQEERQKNMYLKMYMKGQEAARFEHADQVLEFAHKAPSRVSVPELLQQLQSAESELENMKVTDQDYSLGPRSALLSAKEAISLWLLGTRKAMYRRIVESRAKKGELDPEITLQFLKSAVYYFLTDKENHQGHLNAIESILGYNETEKLNIEKACRTYTRK